MKCHYAATVFVIFSPTIALAHGEQALVLPIGQLGGLLVVIAVVLGTNISRALRIGILVSTLVSAVALWFVPNIYFRIMDVFGTSVPAWLLAGVLQPLLVSGLIYGIHVFLRHRHK